ncbi:uncharacterized protein FFNC_13574 [Fusarium fujikuroi]|nr:uncharacterized protein FFNC_13574 [Fusarium fujikuroi]
MKLKAKKGVKDKCRGKLG